MSLAKKVFTGIKWVTLTRFSAQFLNWAITLIVIRLLAPADYGLLAIASGLVSVLSVVNAIGMSAALIQRKELEADLPGKVFALIIISNAVFFTILFSIAPFAAEMYGEPILKDIIRVFALNHLLLPIIVITRAMLIRKMDFRLVGLVMFAATTSGGLLTLGMAYEGFGVWSLVWGNIFTTLVQLIGYVAVTKYWCRPIFSFKGMRNVVHFGVIFTIDAFVESLVLAGDALILGKLLGKEPTGIFYVAKDLAWLPMRKVAAIVNPIAFAGFSRVQHNPENVTRYVLKAARMIAIVAFPIFLGISCVSSELVTVVLGKNWLEVIIPMAILSPLAAFLMLGMSLEPAINGIGRPVFNLYYRITTLALLVPGVMLGTNWGLTGVSIGVAAAFSLGFIVQLSLARHVLSVPIPGFLACIWKPLFSSGVMYLLVVLFRGLLEPMGLHDSVLLVLLIGVGALAYIAVLGLIDYRGVVEDVRTLRSGMSASAADD